ncbi:MAG: hypothetical protein ACJA06_002629 [Halocynthiibacter sp.]|jgi:hypothetical protein
MKANLRITEFSKRVKGFSANKGAPCASESFGKRQRLEWFLRCGEEIVDQIGGENHDV